jgi:hypothetical protein
MIPWITIRGGPATGREALALQGIPVRDLLLTSETEDQLADLAGNAMTTTVVGASMLAALNVAIERIEPGAQPETDAAQIAEDHEARDQLVAGGITGQSALTIGKLDLTRVTSTSLETILDLASRSSRHCQCEGQSGTTAPITKCACCGYRACKSCGGRPEHDYQPCESVRIAPADFENRLKDLLPMRVRLMKVDLDDLRDRAASTSKGTVSDADWALWSRAVTAGTEGEFRFRHLKRQTNWTAVYESPQASLDLFLDTRPEWRLTVHPPTSEPVNSRLRAMLLHPVARLRIDRDLLAGTWELCIPSRQSFEVEIIGCGELVPSWQASLGLMGDFEGTSRWSQLEIKLPDAAELALDRKLSGIYTLLPKCGQAMASLHRKDDVFFFLDPTRCGESKEDSFVFSTHTDRIDYGVERAVLAVLDPKWRQSAKMRETVRLDVLGGWVPCEATLAAVGGSQLASANDTATFAVPSNSSALTPSSCAEATALLFCSVPLDPDHTESMWTVGKWGEVDLLHHGNVTFSNLAWITERLPVLDSLSSWTSLPAEQEPCQRCSPIAPKIHWLKKAGKPNKNGQKTKSTIIAFEDKQEAGRYEHVSPAQCL